MRRQYFTLVLSLLIPAFFNGCSGGLDDAPETGEVSGKVTLDGKPLANATVTFQAENNRPAFGVTDDAGMYTISFSRTQTGAAIGENIVKISSNEPEGEYSDKENKTDSKIPARYNNEAQSNPDMKKEVKADGNTFDFDLKSGE